MGVTDDGRRDSLLALDAESLPQAPGQARQSPGAGYRKLATGACASAWEYATEAVTFCLREGAGISRSVRCSMGLAAAAFALSFSACPGPNRLTDPIVSEAGTYFATMGGSGSSGATNGGTGLITYTLPDASVYDAEFDWGPCLDPA